MNLELTTGQALELKSLLDQWLREMSHEIAATDNARYRTELTARRQLLADLTETVRSLLAGATSMSRGGLQTPETIVRELAHPGD